MLAEKKDKDIEEKVDADDSEDNSSDDEDLVPQKEKPDVVMTDAT